MRTRNSKRRIDISCTSVVRLIACVAAWHTRKHDHMSTHMTQGCPEIVQREMPSCPPCRSSYARLEAG
eukprot:4097129-Pyramimonas_sp.AAC.2